MEGDTRALGVILVGISAPAKLASVSSSPCKWLIICVVVFVLYARMWLYPLWRKGERDRRLASDAYEQARVLLTNDSATIPKHRFDLTQFTPELGRFLCGNWSMMFQMAVTVILLLMLYVVSQR